MVVSVLLKSNSWPRSLYEGIHLAMVAGSIIAPQVQALDTGPSSKLTRVRRLTVQTFLVTCALAHATSSGRNKSGTRIKACQ